MGGPAANAAMRWGARLLAPWRGGLEGLDRRVYLLVLVTVLTVAARMGIVAFLGIYFSQRVGIDLRVVGLAFLLESAMRGLAAPVGGALSDRLGRRAVLLPCLAATALTLPAFVLVRDAPTLLAWSALLGVVQGSTWPVSSALLLDLVPASRRQTVLSLNYTALALGYTIGVLPAGYIATLGYGWLGAAAACGALLAVVILALMRHPPAPTQARPRSLWRDLQVAPRDRAFLGLASLALIFPLGLGLVTSALAIYASGIGLTEPQVGFVLALNGPVLVLFAIPVNARIERTGPYRFLPLAAAVLALCYLLIAAWPTLWGLALATLVFTLGELVFSAALPTAVASLAPEGMRGAYQGAWAFVFSMAAGSALALSGALEAWLGWRGTWLAWALLTAAAGLALALARPTFRRIADARAG